MNTKGKAILNLVLFLATLAFNALGLFGVINGNTQEKVSNLYDTHITPSPFAFSIWGVLYTLLLITLLYWIIRQGKDSTARVVEAVSPLFWLSNALNIAWIVSFSYELIGLSTVFILGLAVTLVLLNLRLKTLSGMPARLGGLSFGLYSGWILIAAFVNVAAFLIQLSWDGFGLSDSAWSIIILTAAMAAVVFIQLSVRNAALTLPIAWAYYGIWNGNSASGRWKGLYPEVSTVALIGVVIALLVAAAVFVWNKRCVLPLSDAQRRG